MEHQTTLQAMAAAIKSFHPAMQKAFNLTGKSYVQLSDESGVPYSNVQKFYNGNIPDPKLIYTAAICKITNFSLDEHFDISASADSRIKGLHRERDTLAAEVVELRHQNGLYTAELSAAREQLAFYKQQVEFKEGQMLQKDTLLSERADFLRMKDGEIEHKTRTVRWMGSALVGCVMVIFYLLIQIL